MMNNDSPLFIFILIDAKPRKLLSSSSSSLSPHHLRKIHSQHTHSHSSSSSWLSTMDIDFRASTIHSTIHPSSLHAARLHNEKFSVFSYGDDDDDDAKSLFQCPHCDFEIEASVLRTRLQEVHCFDPKNKVCPVCDEKIGEDAIGIPQHSNSRKRTMRFEKSSTLSGDLGMIDQKLASWGNKHYPVSDPPSSPFSSKSSVPSPSSIISDEDSVSTASDISNAKSLGTETPDSDAGDEQDHQERSQRASFVQDLMFSTLV